MTTEHDLPPQPPAKENTMDEAWIKEAMRLADACMSLYGDYRILVERYGVSADTISSARNAYLGAESDLESHLRSMKPAHPTIPEGAGWQPIETAPKDGSMFLCWVQAVRYGETDDGQQYQQDVSQPDFCWWRPVAESPDDGYFDPACGQIADSQMVSHWMPLPKPPESLAVINEPAPAPKGEAVTQLRQALQNAKPGEVVNVPPEIARAIDDEALLASMPQLLEIRKREQRGER